MAAAAKLATEGGSEALGRVNSRCVTHLVVVVVVIYRHNLARGRDVPFVRDDDSKCHHKAASVSKVLIIVAYMATTARLQAAATI